MLRLAKISLKIISILLGLLIIVWLLGAFYINRNKAALLNSILTQLNKNINGKITATSMEPTLIKGFPGASVSLKNVVVSDSLVNVHHHNLLQAKDINVSLNVLSLLTGKTKINKIAINDASVYVYTDSSGYTNTNIFRKKNKDKSTKSSSLEINKINFNQVDLKIDNKKRHKLFDFTVHEVVANVKYPDSGWVGTLKLNTLIKSFAFNTQKGSFLKNKTIAGILSFHYSSNSEKLIINPRKLNIGGHPFTVGATIDLAEKSNAFAINIAVNDILYKDISMMLSPNISSKLLKFDIKKPINIKGKIIDDGSGKYADPMIDVDMSVRNNIINLPAGTILTDCNFEGNFSNRDTLGGIIGDENSAIKFRKLSAKCFNAPLNIEALLITNLARPIATGVIKSKFNLDVLNASIGGNNFNFKKGTASLNLFCKADIDNFNFTKPIISGKITIQDADIKYIPRNLHLTKSAVDIEFKQNNLSVNNAHFQLGKSTLNVDCSIDNFLNLYYSAPEKILVNLKLNSPQLYLNEFLSLLGTRNTKKVSAKADKNNLGDQLSKVLELSKMDIQLGVKKAIYNKFMATDLEANIALRGTDIYFNKINVKNAGGALALTGNIKPNGSLNKFTINSKVSHVNVQQFFYSFDSFGLKSIKSENLRGYLSALVKLNGKISQNGTVIPKSMDGTVALNLRNAALVNFQPLVNVGKYVFRSRNLSDLRINNLDGDFKIDGEKIFIEPMEINSSAINLNVKGLYSLGAGTDISMDIPLRNPKGDELLNNEEKESIRMNGFVLRLKAIDDEKGGVKLKWNRTKDKSKK